MYPQSSSYKFCVLYQLKYIKYCIIEVILISLDRILRNGLPLISYTLQISEFHILLSHLLRSLSYIQLTIGFFIIRYTWKIPVTYTSSNQPSFTSSFTDIIWMDHKGLGMSMEFIEINTAQNI